MSRLRILIGLFVFTAFFFIFSFSNTAQDFDSGTIADYNAAVRLFNNREFEKALRIFERLYYRYKDSAEIKNNYIAAANAAAIFFIEQNDYNQAIEILEKINLFAVDNNIVKENLGAAYLKLGNNYFAVKDYGSALKYYLTSAQYLNDRTAYENIASLYFNKAILEKNDSAAVELYHTSLKYNPDNYEALFNIGIINFNRKKFNDALKYFERIINSSGRMRYSALLYKGIILEERGDYNNARGCFEMVVNYSSEKNDIESARRHLSAVTPQNYRLSYMIKIKNPSFYNLKDLSILINIPNSFNNRQRVSKTEITSDLNYIKDERTDTENNRFLKLNFSALNARAELNIKIDNYLTVLPAVWNLEKLNNRRIKIDDKYGIANIISRNDNLAHALRKIYDYTLNLLEYEIIERDLSIAEILKYKRGKCVEYAALFDYLAAQLGLKSRMVCGEAYSHFGNETVTLRAGHSWTEIWFDGLSWVGFDPTFEDTGNRNYFGNMRSGHIINSYGKVNFIDLKYKVSYTESAEPKINLTVDIDKELVILNSR